MSQLAKLKLLQNKISARIEELKEFSQKQWGVSPSMKIIYDLESVDTIGLAVHKTGSMRLNKHILLEFGDVYIDEIVVHEYAHFVVTAMYRSGKIGYRRPMPHGKEFKAVCSHFGIDGKSTSKTFNDAQWFKYKRAQLNKNPKKVFYYSCGCRNFFHELSTVRHNKIMKKTSRLKCKDCDTAIKFVKQGTK